VLDDGRILAGGEATISAAFEQDRIDRVRDFVGRFLESHIETRPLSHRAFFAAPNRNAPTSDAPTRKVRRRAN
jgi:hypothetical protein